MYEDIFKQLDANNVDIDSLGGYYWRQLREAVNAAVNHAENGNQMGASLTIGVAREMIDAIEGLFANGRTPADIIKPVDKK